MRNTNANYDHLVASGNNQAERQPYLGDLHKIFDITVTFTEPVIGRYVHFKKTAGVYSILQTTATKEHIYRGYL